MSAVTDAEPTVDGDTLDVESRAVDPDDASARDAAVARAKSVQATTDGTVALVSYRPDTVQSRAGQTDRPLDKVDGRWPISQFDPSEEHRCSIDR